MGVKSWLKRKGLTTSDVIKASFALGSLLFVVGIMLYGAIGAALL